MTPLQTLLDTYRSSSMTEREKGTYFEKLIVTYLRHEATYADLYSDVWLYSDWAKEQGLDAKDTGIDLVAKTASTDEYHAIQCKFYAEDHKITKKDIDSFFTASGQKPFTHRIIVSTVLDWTENAELALIGQQPAVTRIDLVDLENSQIDWAKYQPDTEPVLVPKFAPRPHQQSAINNVRLGLQSADRGKLIMACGTGKTFTSLKIAEEMAGEGKRVLFLVPSLSLLSQTLTEWTQQSTTPLHSFAVCSDSEVGKKQKAAGEDTVQTLAHELRYPATTDDKRLAFEMEKRHDAHHMSVVFSTYHSLDVISRAQHLHGLAEFDLIICDEAHRTTGATFDNESESTFVKVHNAQYLQGKKRLYMTATPRIYGDMAKAQAEMDNTALASMDDEEQYGKQLHVITFSEAVQLNLLTDYKVLVLTIDEAHVSSRLQGLLKDENNQLKVDDAARIIGCWKALSKQGIREDLAAGGDTLDPMQRAVAFCQVIEPQKGGRVHKVSSKQIAGMFRSVVEAYRADDDEEALIDLQCEADHVDGSMNAAEKEAKLNWLKAETPPETCRILSNVRCLSEGVDVPALDAVLFLTPRNSPVDVVQSVGRVMRNAPGKKRGYVVLPVVIPVGMEPHEALNDNKVYKVVWDVLQALRSHDDQFDAMINKLDLIGQDHSKLEVVAITGKPAAEKTMEVTATAEKLPSKPSSKTSTAKEPSGSEQYGIGTPETTGPKHVQGELQFQVGELEKALYAKVVKKCGNRNYWDEWAKDIAKIAQTHITRITTIVSDPKNAKEAKAFTDFADELRDDLNDSITDGEVIEMLAQHLITKPVFDALFKDYSFASHNPVSQAMQQVLDLLHEHRLEKEADTLEKFYASVEMRAAGIEDAGGKQKIVVELYDKFFRNAFPKMTERLGIVYTPVEVVDFIIHSVNDLLQQEFGQTLGSEGVHIIDPFTGTGTFITRLLQSGLISKEQLPHKYQHEIHANEIVLLAYYIAAINIEAVYHGVVGGEYQPFEGICLTDTFRLGEEDLISELLSDNSDRRKKQQKLDVRVIMGNPPYSAGQESANDNNQNVAYPDLDQRIRETYAEHSNQTSVKNLYDSYVRSIRWASDRVGASGIIGFVTNASFVESNAMDGMRYCLEEDFDKIFVFHLRGDQRTSGERSRQEGGKIFGSGSRAPIAITLFLKKSQDAVSQGQASSASKKEAGIWFHDIGDYLSREEKLETIQNFSSVNEIERRQGWRRIFPDDYSDWLSQRDASFESYITIGSKKANSDCAAFENYSLGVATGRDAWCANSSSGQLIENLSLMVANYNSEVSRLYPLSSNGEIDKFINTDPRRISWNRNLKNDLGSGKQHRVRSERLQHGLYRPFSKQWIYFDRALNAMVYQLERIFPNNDAENFAIAVSGLGAKKGFSALITKNLPTLDTIEKGQCFPLYLYDTASPSSSDDLFTPSTEPTRRDGISDAGFAHFKAAYPGETFTKEDLFYYIYGLLHSPEYRTRYRDNLSKELPRIPAVKTFADFMAFSKAGRELAHWHLDYETVAMHPDTTVEVSSSERERAASLASLKPEDFRVVKMKFARVKDPETGKSVPDKSTVIYNPKLTIRNIPLDAYDYVVNGKPALEWVMERQAVTTDKKSGITNDANLWATETMGNAKYPLELFLRVITVSLETNKIVAALPRLEID